MADRFASENATYPSWAELFSGGRGKRIASILTIIVLHGGGNYAVVTLTPSIVADIGGIELIGALTALFNVATLLAAAAIGPLVPRFGTARLWWFMTAIATLGAALSTLADSMVAVAVGRGLAGFGGGGLLAIGFIALRHELSTEAFPKLSAMTGAFWIAAAFSGPIVGGVMADYVGWRPTFAVLGGGVFLYALMNAKAMSFVSGDGMKDAFPIASFFGFGAGVGLISFAPLFDTVLATAMATAGTLSLAFSVWHERNRPPRMFPARAFRLSTVQGKAIAAKTILSASAMSVLVFGPVVLTQLHGFSATLAGAFVLIETIAWSATSFLVVSLSWGRAISIFGPFLSVCGLFGCATFLVEGDILLAAISIAACGSGLGMIWPFIGEKIVAGDVDGERAKTMTMAASIDTLGFAMGGAFVGLIGAFVAGGAVVGGEGLALAAKAGMIFSVPIALIGGLAAVKAMKPARSTEPT